jgi:hypothetical protein
MNKLKKYQKQIVTFITIFLLATYGIFPALTAANTLLNLVGGVGGLILLLWAGLSLKEYITSTEVGVVIVEELEEVTKVVVKPKATRKPKVKKPEYPLPPHHPVSKPKKTK